jgi:predicted extracellular nuclease
LVILTPAFFLAPPATGLQPPANSEVLRLGSWNIQWLGRPDRRGGMAQDAADLAKYIEASKVDVLALSEVSYNSDDGPLPTNKTLTQAFAQIKESAGQEWKHLLFPKEDANDRDQLCGVAWNTARVKMVDWPYRVPVRRWGPSAFVWTRHPHAVKFSAGQGKSDIVVIPVHMKSNVGGAEAASKQRAEEAKALVRNLGGIQNHFKDDDLIILGDFNMLKNTESGHARYTQNGFRDLND